MQPYKSTFVILLVVAALIGLGAVLAPLSEGKSLSVALTNGVMFFVGSVIFGGVLLFVVLDAVTPRHQDRHEDIMDAWAGYTATDDEAWNQFWAEK